MPVDSLKKYGVKVYKMIYVGEINPFRINRYLDIILSERGEDSLKKFLEEALALNEREISAETRDKIRKLINELQQPSEIETLNTNKYYVVYRCDRAFTSSMCRPTDNTIVDSHVAYIECENEDIAYYYAAVLNYLAYSVVTTKRTFTRHQFARPLLVAYIAGLSWNNTDDKTKQTIVERSKELHKKAPSKKYANQKVALEEIARFPEFKEIVETLNSKVDRERLEEALDMVSGKGAKKAKR